MSFTHTTKSGKTIKMENGVTTITKVQNGQSVTKQFNMNNVRANTLIGQAEHVDISGGRVKIGSRPRKPNPGPGGPGGGGGGGGGPRRQVSNQFNITGSVIGQVAIGNKGNTVFNNQQHRYEEGSIRSDYKISGGNFAQANLGGVANFNNDGTKMIAGGGGAGGKPGSIDDMLYSDMMAEKMLRSVLTTQITAEQLKALLQKGFTIEKIYQALANSKTPVHTMVESMLRHDGADSDSDSD